MRIWGEIGYNCQQVNHFVFIVKTRNMFFVRRARLTKRVPPTPTKTCQQCDFFTVARRRCHLALVDVLCEFVLVCVCGGMLYEKLCIGLWEVPLWQYENLRPGIWEVSVNVLTPLAADILSWVYVLFVEHCLCLSDVSLRLVTLSWFVFLYFCRRQLSSDNCWTSF